LSLALHRHRFRRSAEYPLSLGFDISGCLKLTGFPFDDPYRQQQAVIDYLIEENRVLKEQLEGQRL